jgi:hypothetical protein
MASNPKASEQQKEQTAELTNNPQNAKQLCQLFVSQSIDFQDTQKS